MRRLHRWVGTVFGLFFVSSAVTGFLWAYAPYLYWKPGYMEKKAALPSPPIIDVTVTIPEALGELQEKEKGKIDVQSVLLRKDLGRLLYEIDYKMNGERRRSILDAKSGGLLSPLSEELAAKIAGQYVAGHPALESIDLLSNWIPRNKSAAVNAFRVRFKDAGQTEIFLDPDTGAILEDQDRIRRFHFLVMRLHQLNFFGFRKVLTIVSALPLLLMIITGTYLLIGFRIRRHLAKWNVLQTEMEKRISGEQFPEGMSSLDKRKREILRES